MDAGRALGSLAVCGHGRLGSDEGAAYFADAHAALEQAEETGDVTAYHEHAQEEILLVNMKVPGM